jgi:protein-L-isoaspartate O-methyltransferase
LSPKICSMFRETRFTASFEERPAYLAAQLASRGRLWRCESPASQLVVKISHAADMDFQREDLGVEGEKA